MALWSRKTRSYSSGKSCGQTPERCRNSLIYERLQFGRGSVLTLRKCTPLDLGPWTSVHQKSVNNSITTATAFSAPNNTPKVVNATPAAINAITTAFPISCPRSVPTSTGSLER